MAHDIPGRHDPLDMHFLFASGATKTACGLFVVSTPSSVDLSDVTCTACRQLVEGGKPGPPPVPGRAKIAGKTKGLDYLDY